MQVTLWLSLFEYQVLGYPNASKTWRQYTRIVSQNRANARLISASSRLRLISTNWILCLPAEAAKVQFLKGMQTAPTGSCRVSLGEHAENTSISELLPTGQAKLQLLHFTTIYSSHLFNHTRKIHTEHKVEEAECICIETGTQISIYMCAQLDFSRKISLYTLMWFSSLQYHLAVIYQAQGTPGPALQTAGAHTAHVWGKAGEGGLEGDCHHQILPARSCCDHYFWLTTFFPSVLQPIA